jgi:hypothetical protein
MAQVLNQAREAIPTDPSPWITAAKLGSYDLSCLQKPLLLSLTVVVLYSRRGGP